MAALPRFRNIYGRSFLNRSHIWQRYSSDLASIRKEMLTRPERIIEDYLTPVPARLLQKTLADFVPLRSLLAADGDQSSIPEGFHLAYFPSNDALSSLSSDGTDPLHSPGPPFNRRMWAGGSMTFNQKLQADGQLYHLQEKIVDVQVQGQAALEKVFVTLRRTIEPGYGVSDWESSSAVTEDRTLVFMRDAQKASDSQDAPKKTFRPMGQPDFSQVLIPTRELLFRFSALTWNAHAIHLNKQYCQDIEGHRNLLVHGPLTVVLMLRMPCLYNASHEQRRNVHDTHDDTDSSRVQSIYRIDYKNLAPLYAEEPMRVCIKVKEKQISGPRRYSVWIEGIDGRCAVKGTVETVDEKDARQSHQGER